MDLEKLRNFTLSFSLQKGIGIQTLKNYFPSAEAIKELFDNNKIITSSELPELTEKMIKTARLKAIDEVDMLINKLAKTGCKYLCYWEDLYPELLKEIYDFPPVIFYKGNENLFKEDIFGIVGTRNLSEYGKKYAIHFAKELSSDFVIVSGLAIGIDKFAHEGALGGSKRTIAVIPGGPHRATPSSHRKIYEDILENGGLVISENFPGTEVYPGMFASRNRIIAGLSKGLLVIEADIKSGSLITAELANDFGREVFALPGRIDTKQSNGTNKLIREGRAKLVGDLDDVLVEFGKSVKMSGLDKANISKIESNVLETIARMSNATIEELALETKVSFFETLQTCINMELNGLIKKDFSGKYFVN